jgi:subtilisin family serine protease
MSPGGFFHISPEIMLRPTTMSMLGLLALAACAEPPVSSTPTLTGGRTVASVMPGEPTYVILGAAEVLPADLEAQVSAAGGTIVDSYPEIGVALAQSSSPSFGTDLAMVSGVESVTADVLVQWADTSETAESVEFSEETAAPEDTAALEEAAAPEDTAALEETAAPEEMRATEEMAAPEVTEQAGAAVSGDGERFYSFQWAPRAIQAPEAWAAGYTGKGVRVAILDGGLYNSHLDLTKNVDVAASRSFVPGFAFNQDVGTTWHATAVAGVVAAAVNVTAPTGGAGIVGIAPNATLIGVKVLHNGVGTFNQMVAGIMYAAKPLPEGAGAQVINLSLGAIFDDKNPALKAAATELKKSIDRATKYAWAHGVTVIAAAGNAAPGQEPINFDVVKNLFNAPAQSLHVIGVSATGPHGWAKGATDFARVTYYTHYGKALVDMGAPGGTLGLAMVDRDFSTCTVKGRFTSITATCAFFDQIVTSIRASGSVVNGVGFLNGTSMAAPMVTGVAALIIERNGGLITPDGIRARLHDGATDLGKPGNDKYYGHGWVNAFRSIQ